MVSVSLAFRGGEYAPNGTLIEKGGHLIFVMELNE